MSSTLEVPKRTFFKAAELCGIAGVQPYVLKSWEAEFPELTSKKRKDGSRVYGRPQVELVLQIKRLLFVDGLTLGAARRKLEKERQEHAPEPDMSFEDLFGDETRQRLVEVKLGLRGILDLLSGNDVGNVPVALDETVSEREVKSAADDRLSRKGTRKRSRRAEGRTNADKTSTKRKLRTA